MLFQLCISCVAIPLLYSAAPANALQGPPTAATAGEFPQIVIVEVNGTNKLYVPAALLSRRLAITTAILSPGSITRAKAYSGDLVNFGNARHHTVINIVRGTGFSIVKVCPTVASGYTAVSLAESDNFNYQTNTTGKIIYFDEPSQALQYRTADVLPDADCVADNQDGPNQNSMVYSPPVNTCTKFEDTVGSCNHIYNLVGGAYVLKNLPIVLIGNKTAAVLVNIGCFADSAGTVKMTTIGIYNKVRNMQTDILNVTGVVDFS